MQMTQIDRDAIVILKVLAEAAREKHVDRNEISCLSGLPPDRINDAMSFLVDSGLAEWLQTMGTLPFIFNAAIITSRGRYEYQRINAAAEETQKEFNETQGEVPIMEMLSTKNIAYDGIRPPVPIGSPYGFTDEDWEAVATRKNQRERLYTAFGHQFDSEYFERTTLRKNVEQMLQHAVTKYNETSQESPLTLHYKTLGAGYGEHLFNEIARDIIGADIAIFETSDLNPNVMLEMGVALTWGVRVLPIKVQGRPKPPSDVSGQTWADYCDNAAKFVDSEHELKLVMMIQRAIRKKGRNMA